MRSRGERWSIEEYRALWECFILSAHRTNDEQLNWRVLLHNEWTRRGGRQVTVGTLEKRLKRTQEPGILLMEERRLIEERVREMLWAEGVVIVIKDEGEDDEDYANRAAHRETMEELGCESKWSVVKNARIIHK